MSKFVTYPAVTVLDNDHSLLIDDPNAGTNSITAENAGNTLLSKWAGFETFDEAVQNTIENNQEFIDRDTAIRSETAELKKKIVTTFPAKEASGAVATFESEFEDAPLKSCIVQIEPVQDLHGYDSPWPAGGGKNLIQNNKVSEVINGVTFTVHDDGTVTANGTASADTDFDIKNGLSLEAGSYVLSGCPAGGSTSTYRIFATNVGSDTGSSLSFTFNEATATTVRINIKSGTAISNLLFKPMICLSSAQNPTTFAPYENICPITGWTGMEIQHDGTNFFDGEMENGDINQYTGENNGTSSSRYRSKNYIPIRAGSYYFKSPNRTGTVRLFAYDKDKTFLYILTWNVNSSNAIDSSKARYIRFRFSSAKVDGDEQISINSPSSVTDYMPYVGHTYPITFPTEAGTVYGGTLDVVTGELAVLGVKDILTVADGRIRSQFFHESRGQNVTVLGDNVRIAMNRISQTSNMNIVSSSYSTIMANLCSHYFAYNSDTAHWYINNQLYLYLPKVDVGETLESYKTFLQDNPFEVYIPFVTPITYQLTPQEVKTLLGQNNIWADTGNVSVEYLMSDVSWYVEKKLRAFQSILAGVEDSSTASKNYSANTYLVFNDDIYRVTKAITAGETIEEGVNVTKTTVAEQLLALAQA